MVTVGGQADALSSNFPSVTGATRENEREERRPHSSKEEKCGVLSQTDLLGKMRTHFWRSQCWVPGEVRWLLGHTAPVWLF